MTPLDSPLIEEPRDDLVWAALATLLCCPPYGVAATLAAHRARARRSEGDLQGAHAASIDARRHLRRSVILGLVGHVVSLGLLIWLVWYLAAHWGEIQAGLAGDPMLGLIGASMIVACSCPRFLKWITPIGGVVGLIILAMVDPRGHALAPRCFIHEWTGLVCAGCGTLRAIHELLSAGDVGAAIRLQPLLAVAPLAIVPIRAFRPSAPFPRRRYDRGVSIGLVAFLVAFTLVRNAWGLTP